MSAKVLTSKEILQALKRDYQKGVMSALIGAGFSRNVSDMYLSWKDLLRDMIKELYQDEMEEAYSDYKHKCTDEKLVDVESFCEAYQQKIVEREGYLRIPSLYMKRKGFREAIETYIEQRTPIADKEGNQIVLRKSGSEPLKVKEERFKLHKQLLSCERFLNFYTTNYDNLLEFTDNLMGNKTNLITNRENLSNNLQSRNIIKIHGNIRKNTETDSFSFDKDNSLCYILTQEDYDTYVERHEAFSYFMRIAMVSGKFCLIGFSGTDPNYLSWVEWMKDVISSSEDKEDFMIYLVNVSGNTTIDPVRKMFNKNHRIAEINLTDEEMLKELDLTKSQATIEVKQLQKIVVEWNRKELLSAFFRYINDANDANENMDVDNTYPLLNKDNTDFNKITTYYISLWRKIRAKYEKKTDYSEELKTIKEISGNIRFFKSYKVQRQFAYELYTHRKDWSEIDAETFLLAIRDSGLLFSLFGDKMQNIPIMQNLQLYRYDKERFFTLNASTSEDIDVADNNWAMYEKILRCLFRLDFYKAKWLAEEWNATGIWALNKAMILCWFEDDKTEAQEIIGSYLGNGGNLQDRFLASLFGNVISGEFPRKYLYKEFIENNIDSNSDLIESYIQEIRPKLEKPKQRGTIENSIVFGSTPKQRQFESSLRTFLYVINSAMPLEYRNTYLMDIAQWYEIESYLYEAFPYPCFYYSLQYNDEKVLTRIGQDYASNRNLQDVVPDILVMALNASRNAFFPLQNMTGLYYLTAQMYMVVDDVIWFNPFWTGILDHLLTRLSTINRKDALCENVAMACVSLTNPYFISTLIDNLMLEFASNPVVVTSLICDSMNLELLTEKDAEKVFGRTFDNVVDSNPLYQTIRLIIEFQHNNLLNEERQKKVLEKLDASIDELKTFGIDSLIYACYLKGKSESVAKELKSIILSSDLWYNGKGNNGWGYPERIPLNHFIEELPFTVDDVRIVIDNLNENINSLMEYVKKHGDFSFFNNYYLDYLNDALDFISICKNKYLQIDLSETELSVMKTYSLLTETSNLAEMLASADASIFSNALDRLVNLLRIKPLSEHKREFRFIVNRAIMKEPLALNKLIRSINLISYRCKSEIKDLGFIDDLTMLLTVMCKAEEEYCSLNFNLYRGFNNLYLIAKTLKEIGVENSSITYWMSDPFVLKFVKNKKDE